MLTWLPDPPPGLNSVSAAVADCCAADLAPAELEADERCGWLAGRGATVASCDVVVLAGMIGGIGERASWMWATGW